MDSAFDALSEEKAAERRREMREMLMKMARLSNENGCDIMLLAGDLFDSALAYHETQRALCDAMEATDAEVFIAPGNHDFFCKKSPYFYMEFPKNVHIFKSPTVTAAELPEKGCRVYGAGFNAPRCMPLLGGFRAEDDGLINLMVIHGDMSGDMYNHITEQDIAASGLDYLALGHTHTYSGIKKAGRTHYAYSGCIEGRGFDETGEKGVIIGEISREKCDLRFVPMGGRQYRIIDINLDGTDNAAERVLEKTAEYNDGRDIARIILRGEYNGRIDAASIENQLSGRFYNVTVRDDTVLTRDIWENTDGEALEGIFLKRMRSLYDSAEDYKTRERISSAARYGIAALENREEWRP